MAGTGIKMANIITMFRKTNKVILAILLIFVMSASCTEVGINNIDDNNVNENDQPEKPENVWMDLYPGYEVVYEDENDTLFATHIKANSPYADVGSFNIVFLYDADMMEYESIYCRFAVVEVVFSPGKLEVKSIDCVIGSGYYLELFDITWSAKYTGKTDILWRIDRLFDTQNMPIETKEEIVSEINIVKELGEIKFSIPEPIISGDYFVQNIHLDSEGTAIKSYNFEIPFNSEIMGLDTSVGNNGIEPGADGFINQITVNEDNIIIKGTINTGDVIGSNLDFIKINWMALKRGESNLSLKINEMYTADNVRIKPDVASRSISIHSSSTPGMDIWMDLPQIELNQNESFYTKIIIDTKRYRIAAYGIDIIYDPAVLELDDVQGGSVQAGADGFLTVYNPYKPGIITAAGFDAFGVNFNPELELLIIYWKAKDIAGLSEITLEVDTFSDTRSRLIKIDSVTGCSLNIAQASE